MGLDRLLPSHLQIWEIANLNLTFDVNVILNLNLSNSHTGHVLVRAAGMGLRAGLHAQRLVTAMRFDKFDIRGSGRF